MLTPDGRRYGERFELGGTLCSQVKDKCEDPTILPGLVHTTKGQLVSAVCKISCGVDGVLIPRETCADGSVCDAGSHCMCHVAHRRKLLFGSLPPAHCQCVIDDP